MLDSSPAITDHHQGFDRPWWARAVVGVGLLVLVEEFGLDACERRRHFCFQCQFFS